MRSPSLAKASVADILRALWNGTKPQRWAFYVSIAAFVTTNILGLVAPLFYKKFFDTLTLAGDKAARVPELIGILVVILVLNAANWLIFRVGLSLLNGLEAKTMARLRQQSFDYLIGHSYTFFSDNFSGSLVQKVNRFAR